MQTLQQVLDQGAGFLNAWLSPLVFHPIAGVPVIVYWLATAGVAATLATRAIQLRAFRHAWAVVAGRYDEPGETGEVTHRQALTSALSGTVGLGNIAGVAIALSIGGPGATFWMIVAGLFGMALKFIECTLGQMHRTVDDHGRIRGGPMRYLRHGLAQGGRPRMGVVLSMIFGVVCIGASIGGGNVFQVNQSLDAAAEVFPILGEQRWIYGLVMASLCAAVILGGLRSIARTAERIVPTMCLTYLALAVAVLALHWQEIPTAFATILRGAFTDNASYGGFFGVLARGFRRAAFSNEAGTGSAAIAHSAAKTEEPVREGIVALLEPFLDTVFVCTVTALVIVITGAYHNPDSAFADARAAEEGARLTLLALQGEFAWSPYVLVAVACLFAFSTIITWSYYGERCVQELLGSWATRPYQIFFVICVFIGSQIEAGNAKDLSDTMLLGLALPNVLGLYFLLPSVLVALRSYEKRFLR